MDKGWRDGGVLQLTIGLAAREAQDVGMARSTA